MIMPGTLAVLTALLLISSCSALARASERLCLGNMISIDGHRSLHFDEKEEGCSTNRAFGYATGRQFRGEIAARLQMLGPQLQKAIVSDLTIRSFQNFKM